MDVEDLVSLGRQVKGCPYFASRVMASTAELVFCPYNYILEPNIRKNLGIKLENSILIFDEAHNIETMAADVASFECDVSVLKSAVEELPRILDTSEKAAVRGGKKSEREFFHYLFISEFYGFLAALRSKC